MKNKMMKAPFFINYIKILDTMYHLGWNERNAGNVSHLLTEDEVKPFIDTTRKTKTIKLDMDASALKTFYILITASGKYFRNAVSDPEGVTALIKIDDSGREASLLWGLNGANKLTSEVNTHLQAHIARLSVDKTHRTIIHTHATNINILSSVFTSGEDYLTKYLWRCNTENIIIFPEGIGITPWEIPGNYEIGKHTAQKFLEYKIVLWPLHGVVASGSNLDETLGLIETVEKAAQMYLAIHQYENKTLITKNELMSLAKAFNVVPNQRIMNDWEEK